MFPIAVDVQQFKPETLPLLKVKVQGEHLGEAGVSTAGDHFSAVHLYDRSKSGEQVQISRSSHQEERFLHLFYLN